MVRLDREQRREIVAEMREAGMSSRAIASGLGVDHKTVINDQHATEEISSVAEPTPITGVNGKTYQPTTQAGAGVASTCLATPQRRADPVN